MYLANGNTVIAEGIGQGFLMCTTSSGSIPMKDTLYFTELDGGLLSVKQLTINRPAVYFCKRECTIQVGKKRLLQIYKQI